MVWARPGAVRQLHWHLGIFLGRQRACPLEKKINKQQQQKKKLLSKNIDLIRPDLLKICQQYQFLLQNMIPFNHDKIA